MYKFVQNFLNNMNCNGSSDFVVVSPSGNVYPNLYSKSTYGAYFPFGTGLFYFDNSCFLLTADFTIQIQLCSLSNSNGWRFILGQWSGDGSVKGWAISILNQELYFTYMDGSNQINVGSGISIPYNEISSVIIQRSGAFLQFFISNTSYYKYQTSIITSSLVSQVAPFSLNCTISPSITAYGEFYFSKIGICDEALYDYSSDFPIAGYLPEGGDGMTSEQAEQLSSIAAVAEKFNKSYICNGDEFHLSDELLNLCQTWFWSGQSRGG